MYISRPSDLTLSILNSNTTTLIYSSSEYRQNILGPEKI